MIQARRLPVPSQELQGIPLLPDSGSSLSEYLKDASQTRGEADQILFPTSEEEVAYILRQANRTKTPITTAGAGTGLTGGRVPPGGILLSTERMDKIIRVDWDDKLQTGSVVVQPGVSLRKLEETLEKRGLFYPPNPGEKAAFIGGTVATNASGARSFKYGPTRRYVQRLHVILSNGDLLECVRGQERASGGRFKILLSDGETVQVPIPSYTLPSVKNSAGYYAAPDMELIDLFIGSEGTLGVFTETELRILKKPEKILSGIFFFPSEKDSLRFAHEARRMARQQTQATVHPLAPRVLEFFDSRSLKLLSQKHPAIPSQAGAAIFFEQEIRPEEETGVRSSWIQTGKAHGALLEGSWISGDPQEQQGFREFRYDLPVLVNQRVAANGFQKIGTDMAVPDDQDEGMLDFYLEKLSASGINYCLFGHIGDNHLHANLLPKSPSEFEAAKTLYAEFARKAVELGGTISAEHGIGKLRIPYLEMMLGRQGLQEIARVKKALDPNTLLNPGAIIALELLK